MKTIKFQLITAVLLICAVPIIVITVYQFFNTISSNNNHAKELSVQMAETINSEINTVIESDLMILKANAQDASIKEFLAGPKTDNSAVTELFVSTTDLFASKSTTVLTGTDGMQLVRGDGTELLDVSDREYYKQAAAGNIYVSDASISKSSGKANYFMAVPVKENDKVIGLVQRGADVAVLQEALNNYVAEDTDAWILDRAGNVVAHTKESEQPSEELISYADKDFYKQSQGQDSGSMTTNVDGTKKLVSYVQIEGLDWYIYTSKNYSAIMGPAVKTAMVSSVISVVILVIAAVLIYLLAMSISKPIVAANNIAQKIADGDIAIEPIEVKSKNEIGQMSDSLNRMLDQLNQTLNSTHSNANTVFESATAFSEISEQSADALTQISGATADLAKSADDQRIAVENAKRAIEEMSEQLSVVSDRSEDMQEESKSTIEKAKAGNEIIDRAVRMVHDLQNTMEGAAKVIETLSEQSQGISQIVETISEISDQTNLLSLNASIEAARAGEHGRGFAVVAGEVNALATQSREAATRIDDLIKTVLDSTAEAVESMESGVKGTKESAAEVIKAGDAFKDIVSSIETLSGKVRETSEASAVTMEASKSTVSAIENIEEAANAISESTTTISASTEEQTASLEEIASSSHQMTEVANKLNDQVAAFQLR